jgi:hypothetical protein
MNENNDREFLVNVNSISVANGTDSSKQLLPTPIYSYIDSTVAEIWLPEDACKLFETEFGLTWDNATQLYFVSDSQHNSLVARNANITFSISVAPQEQKDVKITLPYAAFDLIAKPPYRGIESQQRYFPLRRAIDSTQYTLGRTFLQEAYLAADWERQTFSVSQCSWLQPNIPKSIVPVLPIVRGSSSGKRPVGTGIIAGITVAVVLLIAVIIALSLLLWRSKKRKRQREEEQRQREEDEVAFKKSLDVVDTKEDHSATIVLPKHELDASEESTMVMLEKDTSFYGKLM